MWTSYHDTAPPSGGQWAAARPRSPSSSGILLLALWATLGGLACKDQTDPFQCGTPLDGSKDVVQDCSEPGQICVCETRSCARKVDKDLCESTYQYLERPFVTERALDQVKRLAADGGPDADLRCVPQELLAKKTIKPEDPARQCDGTGGTGGAGGGTTTSSSDTGTGGAGGGTASSTATGGGGAGGTGGGAAGGTATITTTGGGQ